MVKRHDKQKEPGNKNEKKSQKNKQKENANDSDDVPVEKMNYIHTHARSHTFMKTILSFSPQGFT